jgi:hypothetical protein
MTREAVATREDIDPRQEAVTALISLTPQAVDVLRKHLSSGVADAELTAARIVLEQSGLLGAAYSFKGHISNQTNYTLKLKSKQTDGKWDAGKEPPDTIAPGASPEWSTYFDGFNFTGKVVYEAEGGEFEMTWAIPLFGNNSIATKTTIGGTKARYEGGRGWHAEVWYFLQSA